MSQDTNVENLIINVLTKAQYESITPSATQIYLITDDVGITNSDIINALGYTPYSSTNPNNYTSNVGTVTSVNGEQPDSNGDVSITIPTVNNGTLDIQVNGTSIGTFTANQSGNTTANIVVPDIPTVPTTDQTYDSTSINPQSGTAVAEAIASVTTPIATSSTVGTVKPDNTTTKVDANGTLSAISRNVGEIIQSTLPLTDAGLHLLDGTLINGGGIYKEFVDYIAELYADNPTANYFCTETEWQASVTQYGSCGKFVYNNTTYYAWYYDNSTTVYTTSITLGDTVTLYSIKNGYITNLNKTAEIQEKAGFTTITIYDATGWHARNSDKDELINTVRLPKVSDILQGTTDLSALGDLVVSGLPQHTHTRGDMNITGNIIGGAGSNIRAGGGTFDLTSVSGAFQRTTVASFMNGGDSYTSQFWNGNFDASRNWTGSTSNANYTSPTDTTSKVQPQTIKTLLYIVIATSSKTDVQVDIDNIATDLNGKANTDLSNVSNTAGFRKLVELYNNGTSFYKIYKEYNPQDGSYVGKWCEQGGVTIGINGSSWAVTSYLKNFINTDYTLLTQGFGTYTPSGEANSVISDKQVSYFTLWSGYNGTKTFSWQACGYIR